MMKHLFTVAVCALIVAQTPAAAERPNPSFTKLWSHTHLTPGQLSEIPAYDKQTNTIWVAGVVGVDVLSATTGALVQHIDVTPYGLVNSVTIHEGLAALAVESSPDRRNPGSVLLYDTATRTLAPGINRIQVGSLPDMLVFTHDGSKLLVANEATPNAIADTAYTTPDPTGSVTIIDMETRTVVATAGFAGVPLVGPNIRLNTGMDFEPEYIAVDHSGKRAFVTLQEANAVAELDLTLNAFTQVVGLGAKDFGLAENAIDPKDNDGTVLFRQVAAKGFYMPDSIATYKWVGHDYLVMANEGDFREDNADRAAASSFGFTSPLDRLRVTNTDSSSVALFAAGARSFSIRDDGGNLVYDSGNILDTEANRRGIYDDGRSRDKGVEPEGVALLDVGGRTYAFVGLERTTTAAVAVFDISDPFDVNFLDMIVTPGDRSPEGLAVFKDAGQYYLAIANEVPGEGQTQTHTTLYRVDVIKQ
jgi:DNA-binding beta-propeller fold protein YncE